MLEYNKSMKKTCYIICFKSYAGTVMEKTDECFNDYEVAQKIADNKNKTTCDYNSYYYVKEITKEVNDSLERV